MNVQQKSISTLFVLPNKFYGFWSKVKKSSFKFAQIVLGFLGVLAILFGCQILAIAVADRLGISPKTSVLVSSAIYILSSLVMAFYAGLGNANKRVILSYQMGKIAYIEEPVCKILMIRKKGSEQK